MKPDRRDFLDLSNWPLSVDEVEAGHIIGFEAHEVLIAAKAGEIPVLGGAKDHQKKLFPTEWLKSLTADDLHRIRRVVMNYWKRKNATRSKKANGNGASFKSSTKNNRNEQIAIKI